MGYLAAKNLSEKAYVGGVFGDTKHLQTFIWKLCHY